MQAWYLTWWVQEEEEAGPIDVVGLGQAHREQCPPRSLISSWCCSSDGKITAKCRRLLQKWEDYSEGQVTH